MMVTEKKVNVQLTVKGEEPVHKEGELSRFTVMERAIRAGVVMFASILLAASIIPIPIVHLVGIPLILIVGIVVSIKQFRSVSRLAPMKIPCPKCGEDNLVGGGLGYRTATGPVYRNCESCRLHQTMTFGP